MAVVRLPDWEPRLTAYLETARTRVREGSEHFCALFSAGAYEAVTGIDPTKPYRGKFREVADDLEATVSSIAPDRHAAFAQRGDLAWYDGSVGVVVGGHALFVGDDEHGKPDLIKIGRPAWVRAWGVGHE